MASSFFICWHRQQWKSWVFLLCGCSQREKYTETMIWMNWTRYFICTVEHVVLAAWKFGAISIAIGIENNSWQTQKEQRVQHLKLFSSFAVAENSYHFNIKKFVSHSQFHLFFLCWSLICSCFTVKLSNKIWHRTTNNNKTITKIFQDFEAKNKKTRIKKMPTYLI